MNIIKEIVLTIFMSNTKGVTQEQELPESSSTFEANEINLSLWLDSWGSVLVFFVVFCELVYIFVDYRFFYDFVSFS